MHPAQLLLLATIAALPHLAHAEPASPPPLAKANKETTLALDYLGKELEARLKAAPGKQIQPDKPGSTSWSPEHRAALKAVFGTEQPLQVKRLAGSGKRSNYRMVIPAHSYRSGPATTTWQDATIDIGALPMGAFDLKGELPLVEVTDAGGQFAVEGFHLSGQKLGDGWSTKSRGVVDSMVYRKPEGSELFRMDSTRINAELKRAGKVLHYSFDMGSERIVAGGETVDAPHMAMRWRNLDVAVLEEFKKISRSLDASARAGEPDPATLQRFGDLFKQAVMRGAAMDIEDISASYRGHKVTLKASLSMPNARQEDFASVDTVVKKLEGNIELTVPLALVRNIAQVIAEKSNKGQENPAKPTAQLASDIYEMMIGKAVTGNFARVENDALRATAELKRGILLVNGKSMPLEPLLAVLKKSSGNKLPPADTSEPARITMRDRGLEAARLFAMNGNRDGMLEMCDRLANGVDVSKDVDQALGWCQKAAKDGNRRAPLLLGELYLKGEADVPGIADLLQANVDKYQSEGANYLLYRLYSEGKGAPKDQRKAEAYLRLAADKGHKKAVAAMTALDPSYRSPAKPLDPVAARWQLDYDLDGGVVGHTAYRFDASKSRSMRLSLSDLRTDEIAKPALTVCLSAVLPSEQACVRISPNAAIEPPLGIMASLGDANGNSRRNFAAAKIRFAPGDKIDLAVYADGNGVHFVVNGKETLVQNATFPVEVLTVGCSAAKCHADFQPVPVAQ